MNRFAILGIALGLPLAASAAFPSMSFTSADETKTLKAEGLVITFADGNLVASDAEGYTLIPLASLASMAFSDDAYSPMDFSGVYTPNEDDPGKDPGGSTGVTPVTASARVTLITAQGVQAGSFASLEEAASVLAKGLYIVRNADGSTSKTIIR